MADERIDIVDKTGKPTGEIRLKSEAHTLGLYHKSVHIWFYTKNGEILFQKRASDKDTFPDLWDISVAGHVGAGELPENAAVREINEEIGLSISKDDLQFIGTYLARKEPKPHFYDNEFHYIYLSPLPTLAIETFSLQKEEVAEITLMTIHALKNTLKNPKKSTAFVPHDKMYWDFIINKISNQLQQQY